MARALRLEYEGAIYHVTARGNERKEIFRDDRDRFRFLEKLAENVGAHHVRLYAFVLMTNHYHLLLETPRGNLTAFMQQFNGSYCVWFNRRHSRSGHLLGGRYKARVVEGDRYLLNLTRYLHLNPVKIGLARGRPLEERIARLRRYRWSSYRAYVGLAPRPDWLDVGPLTGLVGEGASEPARRYRKFVESGIVEDDEELKVALEQSSKAIGGSDFCRWAEQSYRALSDRQGQPLDVAMRRMEHPPEAEDVFLTLERLLGVGAEELRKRRGISDARLLAMKLLKEECGLRQRQVALALGLTDGSGVSRQLKVLAGRLAHEPALRSQFAQIQTALRSNH